MTIQLQSHNVNEAQLFNLAMTPSRDAFGDLSNLIGADVLKEYDEQIRWMSAEIEAVSAHKEMIRQDKAELNSLAARPAHSDTTFLPAADGASAISDTVVSVSSEEWAKLEDFAKKLGLAKEFLANSGTEKSASDKVVATKIFDLLQERLDNQLTDLNSTSEMEMIRFQSLTDSRKQSLMMLSNMLNSDNQAKLAIIQNLKG